ncbi:SusC/RagA family TonB-linked outer membrane protein [Bacteroidales bacterium]|nr:SusC/RagA family TonB-linked outer membrane protein [Bacteroidales bacterium]
MQGFASTAAPNNEATETSTILSTSELNDQDGKKTIKGTIIDENGETVIGASIVIKGSQQGTVSDIDGRFEIVAPENARLIISYIGYSHQEIPTAGNTTFNIVLKEDSKSLEEVIVVGYGVQKKKLVTGATVNVKGEDIAKLNTVSPLSALQSQTPGVNITKKSGQPGEGFKVNIRGVGTIGNSQPLYIVDGVTRGNIDYLNPSDIESLDVLKDAASAAIYGSRAANGVVLVTTKQGKAGKASIEYDGYFGVQNAYRIAPLLNAQEYAMIQNEAQINFGLKPHDFAKLLAPGDWDRIQNGSWNGTNWLDEMKNKDAPIQSHSLNISGGTEQSIYSIGLSYTSQEGIYGKPVQPTYDRYTLRVNTDHTLLKAKDFDIIKFGQNMSYTYAEKMGIGIGNEYWNDIHNALVTSPFLPMWARDANGNDIPGKYHYSIPWYAQQSNPIGAMEYERGHNISKNHNINANFYAVIQPIKNLKYRTSFAFNASASSFRDYKPIYSLSEVNFKTEDALSQNAGSGLGWTFENTLSYDFKIKDDHTFSAMVGTSAERWGLGESLNASNVNSLFTNFDHAYLDNAKVIDAAKTNIGGAPWGKGGILSYFGRVNYNFKEKYMGTVVLRGDGSSNFSKDNRWGYFPSVSGGWVVSNEAFMQDSHQMIDFLKLRASWGENGNQAISPFQYLATISFEDAYYFFGPKKDQIFLGAFPDIMPNPDVTWETSEQINIGVDARFLNRRLGLAFDWYRKTTKDWLVPAPVLASYGTGAPYINGGDIRNQGLEISLNWNDNIGDLSYGVMLNGSYNKNEVLRIVNDKGIIRSDVRISAGTAAFARAEVGHPIGYFWGYKTDGLFQNEQEVLDYKNLDGKQIMPTAKPGDMRFVDRNGDGVIDDEDKTSIGDPNPDFVYGLNLNFGYKGFDLSMIANGVLGNQIMKSYRSVGDAPLANYTTEILGRWHGEGTSNSIPRVMNGTHINVQYISDLYVENGDYLRMSNITLGYDFKKLFPQMPLQQVRLYLTAQNLFTITGYSGMDPEIGTSTDDSGSAWVSGIDVGFYPMPRTYMIGASIKF